VHRVCDKTNASTGDLNDGLDISDDDLFAFGGFDYALAKDPNRGLNLELGFSVALTFKITITTPLLLVSSDVRNEAKKVLNRTLEHYTELTRESIHMHRIVSPSAALVDLWSRSHLVLEYHMEGSLFFLNKLPKKLKACVRHLVITGALLGADDASTRAAWTKDRTTGTTFITNFLTDEFPNLCDVAIEVPGRYEGMEWNWNPASDYLFNMLREGRLDTVHLFYKEDSKQVETDESFLKHVMLQGNNTDENSDDEDKEKDLVGVEKPLSPFNWKTEIWRDLGAKRVVTIKRAQGD
jgi:hypothetical protein